MAVGAYAAFELTSRSPAERRWSRSCWPGSSPRWWGWSSGCRRCASRASTWRWPPWPLSSSCSGSSTRWRWFTDYASSGTITAPPRTVASIMVTGPAATAPVRYLTALAFVALFALIAKNLVRGRVGRSWMAIRDRDIAAEIIGVRPLRTKLLAFAISSFFCGVAGARVRLPLPGERGDPGLRHQRVVPGPVHGHHRRARLDPRARSWAPPSS